MTYCFNSRCIKPQNPQNAKFCQHCGGPLRLAQRFQAVRSLGHSGRSLLVIDEQLPCRPQGVLQRFEAAAPTLLSGAEQALQRREGLGQDANIPRLWAMLNPPEPGPAGLFWVREWIAGPSLADQLREQGSLGQAEVVDVMLRVLAVLERLHQQGVLVGDLRPQSLVWSQAQDSSTRELILVGDRAWMFLNHPTLSLQSRQDSSSLLLHQAPEILQQQPRPASDLYSLGLTAIELLTGKTAGHLMAPYRLGDANGVLLWEAHCQSGISDGLKIILNHLIQPLLDYRYSTAKEVQEALQALALAPLLRSEGTLLLAEQVLSASPPEPLQGPDFSSQFTQESFTQSRVAPEPGSHAAEPVAQQEPASQQIELASRLSLASHQAAAHAALQAGEFQAVGTSALVAAVLANPRQLPLGKLVEKQCHLTLANQTSDPERLPLELWQELNELQSQGYAPEDLAEGWLELADWFWQATQRGHRKLICMVIAIAAYEQALNRPTPPVGDISALPLPAFLVPQEGGDNPATGESAEPLNSSGLGRNSLNFPGYCQACDRLGRLYWMLGRQEAKHRCRCLKLAIQVYHQGLGRPEIHRLAQGDLTAEDAIIPAELCNHLGEAYSDLATLNAQPQLLSRAIQAYEAAAHHCPPLGSAQTPASAWLEPQQSKQRSFAAAIQNNLGTTCWNLAQTSSADEAAQRLQQAIAAYNQAASMYDPDEDAIRYGLIQNNLGTAYLNLGQLEKSLDLLRLAVGTYQVALLYRSRQEAPMSHAATQNNLGTACIQLATHPYTDPIAARESLGQAIAAYETALTIMADLSQMGSIGVSFDLSTTRLNLGFAHQRIGMLSEDIQATGVKLTHLEMALDTYLALLSETPKGSDFYPLILEYINQTTHYLTDTMALPQNHTLLTRLPDHLWVEISQHIQQQIALQVTS